MRLNNKGIEFVRSVVEESQDIEKVITKFTAGVGISASQVKFMINAQPGIKKTLESGKEEAVNDTIDLVNAVLGDLDIYAE